MKSSILFTTVFCVAVLTEPTTAAGKTSPCPLDEDKDAKILEELIVLRNEVSAAVKNIGRLQNELKEYKLERKDTAGGVYVRWGRKNCRGNGTSLVYTGYMAGSDRNHPGTGSNYLCLTAKPVWDYYTDWKVASLGRITGVEYKFTNHKNGASGFFGEDMYNHNAPCALCHTKQRTSIMIPGTNTCQDGWTMEYSGYLVSGSYKDKSATEYVCLDRRPAKVVNGNANNDDNSLFLVEGTCGGSLACPPYVSGREITCVVCSL